MPDLDAAIREQIRERQDGVYGVQDFADALLAVLDLHKPRSAGIPSKPHLADCSVCMDTGPEVCSPAMYPCETVEAIAEALGIEVQ